MLAEAMERRASYQAVAVFGVALAAGAAVAAHLDGLDVEARRRTAADLARGSAFAIEQELSRSLASASALASLVVAGASDAELAAVATRLLEVNGGTANLQLARGGVISHLWPLRGNEAAAGLDILHHPFHGAYVRRVLEWRRSLLYGPFELVQGGAGLALRVPVFVRDRAGERAWGVSSAIIRVQVLLDQSRAPRLVEAGFDWELRRDGTGGGRSELLASSRGDGEVLREPVSVAVELPGQTWALRVAPRDGWSLSPFPGVLHAVVLLVAVLAAVLAYRILSLPEILRREVAARTVELEVAHREQRRAEEAQRHSQKLEAIGLLAGGVAHDFNNLLVGILGYSDLLAEEAPPGSVQEEAARTISQAARRAAELTRQLLAFARLGQQREEQVDVHALVREVTSLLGRTLDKSIRVEMRLDAELHHVRGDSAQLQQVILNLAVNARDAMPEGGTLTLETAVEDLDAASATQGLRPGRHLVLSVSDTGVGIPREHLERIFEPFFTTKGEGRGSGLGLATVYGIVKAHGGAVSVRSEEGHGSRFVVHLPVEREPLTAPARPAASVPRGSGVVLVVDDEEIVRRTAGRMLAALGFEPVLVAGGGEALEWLAAHPEGPTAVLLDLTMPTMDGRACFREMRARRPGLNVVISSGFTQNGRAQELIDAGALAFVQKPYRADELARALAGAAVAAR
jgi:signal transduction histidine kinase/CheY-like chemotaxis protein